MAGITDFPFRRLCHELGAGLTVTEMVASDPSTWNTTKSMNRTKFGQNLSKNTLNVVQIAGAHPEFMAAAAQYNVDLGAHIIDINMGCPAKKVCRRAAGSSLLRDIPLIRRILTAVTQSVDVPVTLKIRTGWDPTSRNAMQVAKIAEDLGISALAIHGRTRACRFFGEVEYESIAEVTSSVDIPVFANGDIKTPHMAEEVIRFTGAAAVMIGRAARGNPWIFNQIEHFLKHKKVMGSPSSAEFEEAILKHMSWVHEFYGESIGVKIFRKHLNWYLPKSRDFTRFFNTLTTTKEQKQALITYLLNHNDSMRKKVA
tara:strand:+ start:1342 stop:2283 length:942 start_codon:yes stop_codon:yes gene_type:complete